MRDAPYDPTNLPAGFEPAFVDRVEKNTPDTHCVANATSLTNGWLLVQHWDGRKVEYPPHAIKKVEYMERERESAEDGSPERVGLASQDRVHQAVSLGGEIE